MLRGRRVRVVVVAVAARLGLSGFFRVAVAVILVANHDAFAADSGLSGVGMVELHLVQAAHLQGGTPRLAKLALQLPCALLGLAGALVLLRGILQRATGANICAATATAAIHGRQGSSSAGGLRVRVGARVRPRSL